MPVGLSSLNAMLSSQKPHVERAAIISLILRGTDQGALIADQRLDMWPNGDLLASFLSYQEYRGCSSEGQTVPPLDL